MSTARVAHEIVDEIKSNMLRRMELNDQIVEAKDRVLFVEGKLLALDDRQRLLETNLRRALIQEIEAEVA